ncbi:hypothetical protein [Nocardia sp. NPDC059228]|uniref:hypothetical protein n=1 Tax=Nocardia sp. NPDC059228 TaxID=3346777 RepID=UPI0036BDFAA4
MPSESAASKGVSRMFGRNARVARLRAVVAAARVRQKREERSAARGGKLDGDALFSWLFLLVSLGSLGGWPLTYGLVHDFGNYVISILLLAIAAFCGLRVVLILHDYFSK